METKVPVRSILSIALPILITTLWILLERNPDLGNALNGYLGLFIVLFLYVATFILMGAGLILGIVALVRGDKGKLLAVLGVVGNLAVVLWIFG